MLTRVKQFITGSDFLKAIVTTFAIVTPVIVGIQLDKLPLFLSIAIGALLTASSDVPGSRKHKVWGILISAAIAMVASIAIGLASYSLFFLLPVMAILVFGISFISVYGFRASLVSFAGLLAIILSFAHEQGEVSAILLNGLLIGLGGLWFLLLSTIFHTVLHKRQTENLLVECLRNTALYIELRGKLASESESPTVKTEELYSLQIRINEIHELLRELLLDERQHSGTSNYKRKMLLILIDLIDILELSLANPANYQHTRALFKAPYTEVMPFIKLVFELSARLNNLSVAMEAGKRLQRDNSLQPLIEECLQNIQQYIQEAGMPAAREGALLLHNLLDYEERILQKIEAIERVYGDLEEQNEAKLPGREAKQFITQQDYDLHILKENLGFKSPIFKHAARLTLAILIGYSIGIIFSIQNAYWILLTVVVIMRPGYTLTKERSRQRLYGTLIGAGISAIVILLSQNAYLLGILSILSFMLAFTFIQKNYRTSSVFVTTSVVFVYALIEPNAFEVIQYRVLDTLVGAAISMGAISFLWPAWEALHIKTVVYRALQANQKYLAEINRYYHDASQAANTDYKLARKAAFLEMGNLNAAFQRMSQEPKGRQRNAMKIYEIVGLNHTFLTAAAALGTFIRDNPASTVSQHFEFIIKSIDTNLTQALQILQHAELEQGVARGDLEEAYEHLEEKYEALVAIRTRELQGGFKPIDPHLRKSLQEARLITDQLRWLASISANIKKAVEELEKL